jgi:hypothetical protein
MTRKFMMITTAIVAIAVAPTVFAQSTSGTNSTASGVNAKPPLANQMPAPTAPSAAAQSSGRAVTTTAQVAQPSGQKPIGHAQMAASMSPKAAAKPPAVEKAAKPAAVEKKEAKVEKKEKASLAAIHRSPGYKAMNEKEMATTRDLNRQAVGGGVPQSAMTQSSMLPTPMTPSTPGTGAPQLGGRSSTTGAQGPNDNAPQR